jgi:phosphatidylglycerol:prolipoprotein diacylglycerol transferase
VIPNICHIYGPFYLNNYGLCIFVGILAFTFFGMRNWLRRRFISADSFIGVITWGTLVGIAGGRILYLLTHTSDIQGLWDIIALWDGGLSLLGAVVAIAIFVPLYLKAINVPVWPVLDLAGVYTPLLIGISRFGCFFAGCCYGKPSSLPWAITYLNPDCLAPLGIPLHPAQIYSALTLISLFFIIRFVFQPILRKPGQLFGLCLVFIGAERSLMEFVRDDLERLNSFITVPQAIGLSIVGTGVIILIYSTFFSKAKHYSYEPI